MPDMNGQGPLGRGRGRRPGFCARRAGRGGYPENPALLENQPENQDDERGAFRGRGRGPCGRGLSRGMGRRAQRNSI